MREPQVGDLVIHCVDSILVGGSAVATTYRLVEHQPPSPAPWEDSAPYYRVDLRQYCVFSKPCTLSELMRRHGADILLDLRDHAPQRYPFFATASSALHTVQGAYLTKCSPLLCKLIRAVTDARG